MNRRGYARSDDFEAAFRSLFALAYRVALRILGNQGEAEDAASETLARALVSWPRLRRAEYQEAWVARVASNVATDVVRRRSRVSGESIDFPVGARDSEVVAALVARGLLKSLPRRQREVIVLRYLVDRTEEEVAQALGISLGAVKAHAHRAMRALRERVSDVEATEADA